MSVLRFTLELGTHGLPCEQNSSRTHDAKRKSVCRDHMPEHMVNRWGEIPYLATVSRTFNSLFKVLFIFRSHYLFAIGLVAIFSLAGGISRDLSCSPKQLDSCNEAALLIRGTGVTCLSHSLE